MRTRKIADSEKVKHPNMDYVIELSRGKEYFTEAAFFELFNEIAEVVSKNDLLHDVSGSLPIDELKSKLLSMRFSKEEMRTADNEKALEMYGFTDCINQLLEWLQPQRQ